MMEARFKRSSAGCGKQDAPVTLWSFAVWGLLACALATPANTAQAQSKLAEASNRGSELYSAQCALCHGDAGQADGPAAYLLNPPARDFTEGRFKLTSTQNGVPSDEDLVASLKRGMPGSAMPGWAWMPDSDLRALAGHVRKLAVAGIVDDLRLKSSDSVTELWARARALMTPGDALEICKELEVTPELLRSGKAAYLANCAACHGDTGQGTAGGQLGESTARDLTRGLLKGGTAHADLDLRIQVGMHGSEMPAADLNSEQRSALVAYLSTLIHAPGNDWFVQRRETIAARRVKPGFLWDADDDVHIVLAPLWWQDEAVLEAGISAVHDGREIMIRIRWDDPTPEAPTNLDAESEGEPYADAVALQLSEHLQPPIFGMGSQADTMNIWHWKALYIPHTEDVLPLLRLLPHRLRAWVKREANDDRPLYQLAAGPLLVAGKAVAAIPAGMSTPRETAFMPNSIGAFPTWNEGSWEVILTRNLESNAEAELPLKPAAKLAINFAIWNASVDDPRGQKSVSIWHVLELEE